MRWTLTKDKTFFIIFILLSSSFLVNTVFGEGESWLTGWKFRKSIIVNQTNGSGVNPQVILFIQWDIGDDSNSSIYLDGNSQNDFDDLRITRSDGETLLNHTLIDVNSGYNCSFAFKIVGNLSDTNIQTYLYFGNENATDTSNTLGVFIDVLDNCKLFANFDEGSGSNVTNYALSVEGSIVGGSNYAWVDGLHYKALNFTVGDSWLRFYSDNNYDVTSQWTVISNIYQYGGLVYPFQRNNATAGFWIEKTGAGYSQTFLYLSGGIAGLGSYGVTSGQWLQYGASYNSGVEYNIVLNGSEVVNRTDLSGNIVNVSGGNIDCGAGTSALIIDELWFFSDALTDEEFSNMYSGFGDGSISKGYVYIRNNHIIINSFNISDSGLKESDVFIILAFIAIIIAFFTVIIMTKKEKGKVS